VIIGIGIDSIEIDRVARAVRGRPRLRTRLYTARELAQLPSGDKAFSRMAALFAGKEAVLKALGTGLKEHSWQQVEILHDELGAPGVHLHGQAASTAAARGIVAIHISLTHDQGRAMAFCVAEGMK
jgi:holo-[acyl-carrier protein] synthase